MIDTTLITFLQEILKDDECEVRFPITEYMERLGIPFERLDEVKRNVIDELHRLMDYLCTWEVETTRVTQTTYTRLIPSFAVVDSMIQVKFAEWTKGLRDEEDWLVYMVVALENAKWEEE